MSTRVVIISFLLLFPCFGMCIRIPRDTNQTDILTTVTNILSRTKGNVSIVAWENIYDSDGKIIEVETVELVIPAKDIENEETFYDDFFSRSDQHRTIKEFGPLMPLHKEGKLIDVFVERETEEMLFYWNPHTTYFRFNGIVTFNSTVTTTQEEVDKFLAKEEKHNHLLPLLTVEYEAGGKINLSNLSVSPTVVTYVVSSEKAPDKVLLEAPVVLSNVFLRNKEDDIPEALAKELDKKFPEYDWRVLVNPGESRLIKEFSIRLGLDGFSFYEQGDEYLAYAVNK